LPAKKAPKATAALPERRVPKLSEADRKLPDTAPLPNLTEGFEPLPTGALLRGRYAVHELRHRSSQGELHVYLVEDLVTARECANCGAITKNGDEQFCAGCGADISARPAVHLRYRVREAQSGEPFGAETQLLELNLAHPGLRLPVAAFTEAPYGPPRHYLVTSEFVPVLASTLTPPEELPTVLQWGVDLAEGMAYLHRYGVVLSDIRPERVAIGGQDATWTHLREARVLPPAEREEAPGGAFAKDVRGLASLLLYLATGGQGRQHVEALPPDVRDLLTATLQRTTDFSASTFAARLKAAFQALRRPSNPSLVVGRRTDVGQVRSLNEDSLLTLDVAPVYRSRNNAVGVFLVADGMGGHDAGDVASELTASTIGRLAAQDILAPASGGQPLPDPETWLTEAVRAANDALYKERQATGSDMGTTLVLTLFIGTTATIANVGDSRAYHLTPEGITRVTVDHSLVERLVATGQISREEAETHPQKNVIYRVMGDKPRLEVDLYKQQLHGDDALLLCSDGLNGMISDEQIWQIWQASSSPQEACNRLVKAANQAGGEDNVTVVIVQVE
jgi:protein phosphatase